MVRRVLEGEVTVAQAARELGVAESMIARWKLALEQEWGPQGLPAFPGNGNPTDPKDAELALLRRENERLRQEQEILKSHRYLLAPKVLRYGFIQEHQGQWTIGLMCQVLEVSGYYAWKHQSVSCRQEEDGRLLVHIQRIFLDSCGRYGSPQVHQQLRKESVRCSRKHVERLMREHQLALPQLRVKTAMAASPHWGEAAIA